MTALSRAVLSMAPLALMAQSLSTAETLPMVIPGEIVANAPASAWTNIDPADLLILDLEADPVGNPRRVVIQLMPPPVSAPWVQNVRMLATAHWWDGLAVVRAQDNYVVQWGSTRTDRSPPNLQKTTQAEYTLPLEALLDRRSMAKGPDLRFEPPLTKRDVYAPATFLHGGWPYATDGKAVWPVHCYAMVGVGREMTPDAGSGMELYTVIGHAPRHLDRNVPLIGRIIEGIEHLSTLPRGKGDLGFYTPAQIMPRITRIVLASELPRSEQPAFQYLSTASATFRNYAIAKTSRRDDFFSYQPGAVDICNVPVPVRRIP